MGRPPGMGNDGLPTTGKRYADGGLKYLWPRHREIARRLAMGETPGDVSDNMGISKTHLSWIIYSPMFKMEMDKLMRARDEGAMDVNKTLHMISPVAVEILERTLLTTKNEGLRVKVAQDVLDRTGHGAISKMDIRSTNVNVDTSNLSREEKINLLKQRMGLITQEEQKNERVVQEIEMMASDLTQNEGENAEGEEKSATLFNESAPFPFPFEELNREEDERNEAEDDE